MLHLYRREGEAITGQKSQGYWELIRSPLQKSTRENRSPCHISEDQQTQRILFPPSSPHKEDTMLALVVVVFSSPVNYIILFVLYSIKRSMNSCCNDISQQRQLYLGQNLVL